MKIVLVGSYRFPIYAHAFASGFRQAGHEVIELDYEKFHLKGNGPLVSFHNRFQDRYHIGLKMHYYNKTLIRIVEREHPDMVFLYRCYHLYPSTLKRIKNEVVIMSYNNDDPFSGIPSKNYYRYHLSCAKLCDVNFVYRRKNINDYAQLGISNTEVLLPYYIEEDNYYIDINDDIPIAFIGHFENDGRDVFIKAMKDAELPVTIFGSNYWDRSSLYDSIKDVLKPGVYTKDYNFTLNRCQIALVFLSKLNHDTYTRRCFEIPATKTLMLCEYTEDMDKMFPSDECAVYFKTPDELVRKCKFLLEHPEEIKRIALNGNKRLKTLGGTVADRCRQIEKIFKTIRR